MPEYFTIETVRQSWDKALETNARLEMLCSMWGVRCFEFLLAENERLLKENAARENTKPEGGHHG